MKQLPGIFNDVIGPVMRGPSSSHTAASWRIARTALDILNDDIKKALVEFDRDGAWAPNYREQGTCMGIQGGLLGLGISDERMKDTDSYARELGIDISYQVSSFPTDHANTVRLTLEGSTGKKVQVSAVSTGGGSFNVRSISGCQVNLNGDLFELLLSTNDQTDLSSENAVDLPAEPSYLGRQNNGLHMYRCSSSHTFSTDHISYFENHPGISELIVVHPVMPVISGKETELPFNGIQTLVAYAEEKALSLASMGLLYEGSISGMTDEALKSMMFSIIQIIEHSIDTGLKGTQYKDRILPQQSHLVALAEKEGRVGSSIINQMIAYVTALMEAKSAMEVIVAVPTAGSCGTVGGSLHAVSEALGSTKDQMIDAYFAAGIVGAYFAQGPGFSAEEHGCQVECGAAAGMAAAAIVQLFDGTAKQGLDAASMAIQNMIGLVCDPVADRVEVPCLGKNISAAVNAYSSAVMAISGFDAVIPLEQVIRTVSEVSKTMPACVKCTGKGGLAMTEASKKIKNKLKHQ